MPVVLKVGFRTPALPAGTDGQVLGYDANGDPVAVNIDAAGLPVGTEGQVIGYDETGTPVAVDMPGSGGEYDDTEITARVTAAEGEIDQLQTDMAAIVPYDDTALAARMAAAEGDIGQLQYDDTALAGRVTDLEADVAAITPYDDTALVARVTQNETDIAGLSNYDDTALAGRVSALEGAPAPTWEEVSGKPTEFTPSAHSHAIDDVTGLQDALDSKQPVTTFKTVNGEAVTGAGNIDIPAGADGADAPPMVVLTQAAYDALTPPDPETYYFITG